MLDVASCYAESKIWNEDVLFWKDEISFLHRLVSKKFEDDSRRKVVLSHVLNLNRVLTGEMENEVLLDMVELSAVDKSKELATEKVLNHSKRSVRFHEYKRSMRTVKRMIFDMLRSDSTAKKS